jgi:hypothetical protein
LKTTDFTVDNIWRKSHQTSLPPFIIILSLRFRSLGLTPEKSILWAREIFEKHPSEKILAAYESVLDILAEETDTLRLRELCEKMQALDEDSIANVQAHLAFFGLPKERLSIEGVRMNFTSRLLYQFYDWGELSGQDLNLFTKILLARFDPLLQSLTKLIDNDGTVCLDELDPDQKPGSIGEYADAVINGLEHMLLKHGQYQGWLRQQKPRKSPKKA